MASKLFSPITVGGLNLSNRLVVSPMCQYSAVDGLAQPWHLVHIGGLALSGAGLVIFEATAVEARGRISPNCLGLYRDDHELVLRRYIRDIRSFSETPIGIQLGHAGRKAASAPKLGSDAAVPSNDWHVVGPSAKAVAKGWPVPTELDDGGLLTVKKAFVSAAERADRCGFDLIEIHAAHAYLLSSFVSPLANFRTDRYGGSLENRMRFPLEVCAAVREVWHHKKALGIRINGSDWHPSGLSVDDAVTFAGALKRIGFDYVAMSAGGQGTPGVTIPPVVPGYMVEYAKAVRSGADVKTMAVGMILEPAQAEAILSSGEADLIAIGRGFLDNPRWGWHAAHALGADISYAPQYARAAPAKWPGYAIAHR